MNKIELAKMNMQEFTHVKAVDPYPIIYAYQDSDGYLYNYTIYHLEQLTKL